METSTRILSKATVLRVTSDTPPALMVRKRAVGSGGTVRHFTFLFPVLDPDLRRRLSIEVQPGDEVETAVVTLWREDGYTSYLESFRKITEKETLPEKQLAGQAA